MGWRELHRYIARRLPRETLTVDCALMRDGRRGRSKIASKIVSSEPAVALVGDPGANRAAPIVFASFTMKARELFTPGRSPDGDTRS